MKPESNKGGPVDFYILLLASSLVLLLILFGYNCSLAYSQLADKDELSYDEVTNNNTNTNLNKLVLKTTQNSHKGEEVESVGFVTRGTINSVITVPDSKWIAIGDWHLTQDYYGNITLFAANTTWYNSNGTSVHTHELEGLTQHQNVTPFQKGQGNDIVITGVTDIRTNNREWWNDVPISISIKGKKIVAMTIDDYKTNHHFIGQPILGIVSSFLNCPYPSESANEVSDSCDGYILHDKDSASNATIDNRTSNQLRRLVNGTSSTSSEESDAKAMSKPHVWEKELTSQISPDSKNFSQALSQDPGHTRMETKQISTTAPVTSSNGVVNDLSLNNGTIHDKLITYENSTEGIRISYPSEWRLQESRLADPTLLIAAKFYPSGDNNSPFTIAIRNLTGNVSVDTYANDTINRYIEGLNEFTQSYFRTNTTLSGYDAYVIEGTYIDEVSVKNRLREVGTILNNTAYILQFSSAEHKFPRYLGALEHMIDSFQIIPISISSDTGETNKTQPISQEAVGNTTTTSIDKGSDISESRPRDESTTTPPTEVVNKVVGQQPTLMVTISTASDISLRGEDQTINVSVLNSSSNTGIADSEIDGIIVDGEEAETIIADFNNSDGYLDIDIDDLDGEEFSGETDADGRLIETVEIPDNFEEGNIAIIVTVEADGYDPVSIVAGSTVR
jgi:Probable lipoprotein LpqN